MLFRSARKAVNYAAAAAIIFLLIIIVLTLLQRVITRKLTHYV